jgi:regulator of protease activity HflC (stomatin/prohibitin superfamily)
MTTKQESQTTQQHPPEKRSQTETRTPRLRGTSSTRKGFFARGIALLSLVGVVLVVIVTLVLMSWRTINPGYVGIVFDKATHTIQESPLSPGWAFINPLTQSIQEYPVTIQTYSMLYQGPQGDDSIKVQGSEGQQVNLDVVIQYRLKQKETTELFQDWGGEDITVVEERVVRQYTRSKVPGIAAQYSWEEIISEKRSEIIDEIRDALEEEFALRHLELISFGIREVHLPGSLQKALNNKIQAQQEAEQQRYQLDQARVKAEQVEVEAQGEANAVRVRAEAEAEANKILGRSLSPELITYMQLKQWDGKLPVFQGGGSMPFIDATSLLGQDINSSADGESSDNDDEDDDEE